jgi:transcriptional regulator with XRE-family HTH domain
MAELNRAEISARMGVAREAAGLKQPEIADMLHVHFRSIQDWESPKKRVVPFDRLGEWAELTHVSREWLLYGEEAESTDRLSAIERELRQVREELAAVRNVLPAVDDVLALARELRAALQQRQDTA